MLQTWVKKSLRAPKGRSNLPWIASSLALLAMTALADPGQITSRSVERFDKYNGDEFPTFFKTWPFQRGDAKQVYRVKEENANKYLSAFDDKDLSEQIFREFDWKVESFPYLKWRWRARTLPKGGAENNGATNDSACGIYVVFGKTSGTALKFTWSTTLPVGTVFEKRPGEMVIKAVESGAKNINKWRQQSINIPEVYTTLLKHPMKKTPTGIAILTDGNATHTPAACDYDDFEISANP
ncbi:MAG: hypothetical protein A3F82_03345 [Deltaproteobacteria bacterium RIFCSPLOWO2_12_FULL_44_12]|nr:MAG: hypothetical protein A2712_05325 [Deltaproteobacteria bacterium RIFCSPHIGHO2_01_FULL_43_49]OGQ14376.1 MAG: hypothetical protein A3D22_05060 [Deltaproteobacteria bacterium RIFCSPHIGHO2_02_FULL_44_53]OGQ27584.1 MAG: hypothetical protein A3D98_09115 [Deltaproteobacteria bacterium RIFCSPHIGHO2_12_FULL_44_21]OGQ30817.1 MAG: hypothetical protein A2979_01470 [Deltaproteobacteria bacterium RIFCSPLOWO2_01_FULL_45_74]OGQ42498.1 MAG: hypothetical protein A3I70_10995 [Deltaproteobacteria bacterium 